MKTKLYYIKVSVDNVNVKLQYIKSKLLYTKPRLQYIKHEYKTLLGNEFVNRPRSSIGKALAF